MLISKNYRKLNAVLHRDQIGFGSAGWHWIGPLIHFMRLTQSTTLIDYGAGKGTLGVWMPPEYPVTNYDPVTFPDDPEPKDFVACLDVMEHIEPDCLNDVIAHIRAKAVRAGLMVISMREAQKTLPDGRNAHLIVKGAEFWIPHFEAHFGEVTRLELGRKDELVLLVQV